jgi:hypothetical protein
MSLKLKDPKKLPNGGFLFTESGRTFNAMNSFTGQAKLILIFRQDNALARATLPEVSEDLENSACNRNPSICYDPGALSTPGGGARVTTVCPSCGGQRA